jgi:hypothetical protein
MHETKDGINVRAVTKFGLGLAGGIIVVSFLMWFLFDQFSAREGRQSPRPEPMEASNPQKEPPEPRLQPNPPMELKEFRAAEDTILNNYAWIDPDKGIVRMPVDRAMELVAKEGL